MATRSTAWAGGAIRAGAFAGVAGAVVLALFVVLANAWRGVDPLVAFEIAGASALRRPALVPAADAGAVALGVVLHFVVCAGWGAAFGLLFGRASHFALVLAGGAWGMVAWLVMDAVAVPALRLHAILAPIPFLVVGFVVHLLFGVTIGVMFIPLRARLAPELLPRLEARARRVPTSSDAA